ncbi:MAG: septum formation initiator family protein [Bdellovibrionales bacterium]|nr:septum formation initiator family protein [Bdellovibrionales bacterium]
MKSGFWVYLRKFELKILKKRNWVLTIFGIYLSTLFVFSIIGDRGLYASYKIWKRHHTLVKQNQTLEAEINHLRQEVHLYRHDKRTIEKYAREAFNMQGDGEIQVVFK